MNLNNKPPIDSDKETNPSGLPPISERDFIGNGWSIASVPFWLWIALTAFMASLIWGSINWYQSFILNEKKHDPFLEVTNREFSVFLWQFPSFMRVNVSKKTGYLPGFVNMSENFSSSTSEEFVSAPPDLVFLYHLWNRVLAPDFIKRPITPQEFEEFLEQLPEWSPLNWSKAPKDYIQLVDFKRYSELVDLQDLPEATLPMIVRQSFLGWKNYYMEGPQINALQPTFAQVKEFLVKHPHYERHYWRNISEVNYQKVAGLEYLVAFLQETLIPDALVPKEQLTPFLKVALYNTLQAAENK